MKRLMLLISALMVSSTQASARDILYFKCRITSDLLISDIDTSKVVDDRTIVDISILKIDFKAGTAQDARSEQSIDIVIKRKTALIA